jgi:hypothetical protein
VADRGGFETVRRGAMSCPKCSKPQMELDEWNDFTLACSRISSGMGNRADRETYTEFRGHCRCAAEPNTEERAMRCLDARDCEGINAQTGAMPSDHDYFNYGRGR